MEATEAQRRKATGVHYTPEVLARFVARRLATVWRTRNPVESPTILDPAMGDGQLLVSVVQELAKAQIEPLKIVGYDTDSAAIEVASERLAERFPGLRIELAQRDFLDTAVSHHQRPNLDLFAEANEARFDLIITNPPYVRTQVLGAKRAQEIARRFGLSGRVDLYQAFVRLYAAVLQPHGLVGAILSNRFLMTKGGTDTRSFFLEELPPVEIFDFGDTKLFDAAVLPAVVIAQKDASGADSADFVSVYQADPTGASPDADKVVAAVEEPATPQEGLVVRKGKLTCDGAGGVWRLETKSDAAWFEKVAENAALTFADVGQVRVGIKTTADKVFIRDNWEEVCPDCSPELLRPLVTHHRAQHIRPQPAKNIRVLYTHEIRAGERRAIELSHYPAAAEYLEQHRARLEGRKYVKEAGRKWFEIWVPQDPAAWDAPKVVFRDIADRPTFWLEEAGSVVNGDCYWIAPGEDTPENLLWLLLGVGNSSFILDFYDRRFQNRLYGGRRRFMTQYVRDFPLPDPNSAAANAIIEETRRLYGSGGATSPEELAALDQAVSSAFQVPIP